MIRSGSVHQNTKIDFKITKGVLECENFIRDAKTITDAQVIPHTQEPDSETKTMPLALPVNPLQPKAAVPPSPRAGDRSPRPDDFQPSQGPPLGIREKNKIVNFDDSIKDSKKKKKKDRDSISNHQGAALPKTFFKQRSDEGEFEGMGKSTRELKKYFDNNFGSKFGAHSGGSHHSNGSSVHGGSSGSGASGSGKKSQFAGVSATQGLGVSGNTTAQKTAGLGAVARTVGLGVKSTATNRGAQSTATNRGAPLLMEDDEMDQPHDLSASLSSGYLRSQRHCKESMSKVFLKFTQEIRDGDASVEMLEELLTTILDKDPEVLAVMSESDLEKNILKHLEAARTYDRLTAKSIAQIYCTMRRGKKYLTPETVVEKDDRAEARRRRAARKREMERRFGPNMMNSKWGMRWGPMCYDLREEFQEDFMMYGGGGSPGFDRHTLMSTALVPYDYYSGDDRSTMPGFQMTAPLGGGGGGWESRTSKYDGRLSMASQKARATSSRSPGSESRSPGGTDRSSSRSRGPSRGISPRRFMQGGGKSRFTRPGPPGWWRGGGSPTQQQQYRMSPTSADRNEDPDGGGHRTEGAISSPDGEPGESPDGESPQSPTYRSEDDEDIRMKKGKGSFKGKEFKRYIPLTERPYLPPPGRQVVLRDDIKPLKRRIFTQKKFDLASMGGDINAIAKQSSQADFRI